MTSVTQTQRTENGATPLLVQVVSRPPAPFLRFVDQVVPDEYTGAEFRFSQSVLTRFDVDVVHIVDSELEHLLGAPASAPLQRWIASSALARNLRRHRIALVRTLVDVDSHEHGSLERRARRILDDATTRFVVPDAEMPTPDASRTSVIPHAHFRERFLGFPRHDPTPGRVLIPAVGSLPSHAELLLAAPRATRTTGVTVRIVGEPTPSTQTAVESALARHPHTGSARWERVSDGALVAEITSAELIVLPQVASARDMQMLFVALSVDRPVLTPRTDATARISEEVGTGWIHLAPGPIAPSDIDSALAATRSSARDAQPALGGREPATVRQAYTDVFSDAARLLGSTTL